VGDREVLATRLALQQVPAHLVVPTALSYGASLTVLARISCEELEEACLSALSPTGRIQYAPVDGSYSELHCVKTINMIRSWLCCVVICTQLRGWTGRKESGR